MYLGEYPPIFVNTYQAHPPVPPWGYVLHSSRIWSPILEQKQLMSLITPRIIHY